MKLIDLLVKELPKRGGWPYYALSITQDDDGSLCMWDANDPHYDGFSWKHHTGNSLVHYWHGINAVPLSCDHKESIVTYWQYKAALAESQKPAWNGEGLPPCGVECEYRFPSVNYRSDFSRGKVIAYGNQKAFIEHWSSKNEFAQPLDNIEFRPLRTEAERKRDAAVEAMQRAADEGNNWIYSEYEIIYEAIAAGKIHGVKLED